MPILDYVPDGYKLRPTQRKTLLEVEAAWGSSDVIVIPAPVASGKSLLAVIIAEWQRAQRQATAILTTQVLLQDQYEGYEFGYPVLKGRSHYVCKDRNYRNCQSRGESVAGYCGGCHYTAMRNRAMGSAIAVFNYHSYLYNVAHKDVLIVDEAHNLLPFLADQYSLKLWKHKDFYPDKLDTVEDLARWLENHIQYLCQDAQGYDEDSPKRKALENKAAKLEQIFQNIDLCPTQFIFTRSTEYYKDELAECLHIRPTSIENIRHRMWPKNKVNKIILMSATINHKDVKRIGLTKNRQVTILACQSPIKPERREFRVLPIANMLSAHQKESLPKVAAAIQLLANRHKDTKGLIHIPYSLVEYFQGILTDDRFMFHTKQNKEEVFEKYRKARKPRILFGCGMDTGIDLAGKTYGWQVIAKVLWASKGDPVIRIQAQEDPAWYCWCTARTVIQQYGRICRAPNDRGITYMLDSSFENFYDRTQHMWPEFFKEAIIWSKI